jgi:hypothetical protein
VGATNSIITTYILAKTKSSSMHYSKKKQRLHPDTQFLYLHKFFYGGVTTFTAHLFHTMGLTGNGQNTPSILHPTIKSEHILRDFGYSLHYKNISIKSLRYINFPFITVVKDNYYSAINELSDNQKRKTLEMEIDPVVVIHDPRDVSERIASLIKAWKVVTIRKTVKRYLELKYGIESIFLYHPFFPYNTTTTSLLELGDLPTRSGGVSISRVGFGKNIDLILKANKILDSYDSGKLNPKNGNCSSIKIYGCPTPRYVYLFLDNKRGNESKSTYNKNLINDGDFRKYYYGQFERSFSAISEILSQRKFVVDLSIVNNDGGGTQYNFLEAIHNGCALILHRSWLEGTCGDPEYCDFREGYNCFAIENENELAELIKSDPDTRNVNENARKLMYRHYNIDWSQMIENYK